MTHTAPNPARPVPAGSGPVADRSRAIELSSDEFRAKVLGCWRGKAIGGTLGQSFEGMPGPIEADFYCPVPDRMVPNDDLDVQVAYAVSLAELADPRVDRQLIAQVWIDHITFPWHEYAVARRNLAEGIRPPHSGSHDNWFTCGEGAVIRTELWACLAPGDPERAAAYAYEDACIDHDGDGIWAAVFVAALQSLAFVETDPEAMIDRALPLIPTDSGIRRVVQDTRRWLADGLSWREVMKRIVEEYGVSDFTDTRMNTGFVILGWLVSGGDFEQAMVVTNGCGGDTDSTTASVGALMGICAPQQIPERWSAPIGEGLVIHDAIVGITPPADIGEFTDLVVELSTRLAGRWPEPEEVSFDPEAHAIRVVTGWTTPYGLPLGPRDMTGLSPEGSPLPAMPAGARETSVPGTWTRWRREDFDDLILVIDYTLTIDRDIDAIVMFNCSEHSRVWLDHTYLCGSQPGPLFPAQHRPPVGESGVVRLTAGEHRLRATILRPPVDRDYAEWVVAVTELPSMRWLPHAFGR